MMRRLVREAIGERWFAIMADERIIAARIERDGAAAPGMVADAEIHSVADRMVRVRLVGTQQHAMLRADPRRHAVGQRVSVVVERGGWHDGAQAKLPVARLNDGVPPTVSLAEPGFEQVTATMAWPADRWDWVLTVAAGEPYPIDGGSLSIRATPAMTVIDVDGTAPPADLAAAAARALGPLIRLLDLQGMIVVDLPTLSGKTQRLAIDAVIDEHLRAAAIESVQRTGVNGFGLVQLALPRRGASLVEYVQNKPLAHAVRRLLWAGERCATTGHGHSLELRAPPAVLDAVTSRMRDALEARVGKRVVLAASPTHRLDDLAAMLLSP